jgi:hypothetical protein
MPDEPSRPKFSPAAKPAPVQEDIPEAVRLLRERKKRGQFKTSKVISQERLQKKQQGKRHINFQIAIIVVVIIVAICRLFIQER